MSDFPYDPVAAARLLESDPDAARCYRTLTGQVPPTLDGIASCYTPRKEETDMSTCEEFAAAYAAWRRYAGDEDAEPSRTVVVPKAEYERLTALASIAADEDREYRRYLDAIGVER